jgi:hypothetical protein
VQDTVEVDAEDPVPRRERDLREGCPGVDAGIIADDVHGAELRDGAGGQLLDILRL